jgi:fucose permease
VDSVFRRTRATWAAYAVLALFAYIETVLGPAMPFVRSRLDLSYTVASLHFAAFAGGSLAAGFIVQRVLRRVGRKRALWSGMAGMAAGVSLIAVSPSVVGSIAGALAMGVCGTVSLVANQAILADLHPRHRSVALAESNVAASGFAILAPLALGASDAIGLTWRGALLVALPALAAVSVVFGRIEFPSSPDHGHDRRAGGELPRAFRYLFAVMFLASSIEWCVGYWGADFLSSVVGLRERSAATAMSLYFLAMVAGRFAGSRLARRFPAPTLLVGALAIALASFPLLWLGWAPAVNLAGLFFVGIGIANLYPLIVGAATDLAGPRAEQAAARLSISGAGALLVMPLIVGALSDQLGMKRGFSLIGALAVLALGLMIATARLMGQLARSSRAPIVEPGD